MTIPQQIKHARKRNGMTLQDLGDQIGMTRQNVWAIEDGRKGVSLKRLKEIARILNTEFTIKAS